MSSMPDLLNAVRSLPPLQSKEVAFEATKNLSMSDKQELARSLPDPSGTVIDKIWMMVVTGFVLVFVGAFLAMFYFTLRNLDVDKMLTVFTTVSAFLAGLLVPSPVKR